MGLILDTSILIADERRRFDLPGFLRHLGATPTWISIITASELLHGVERASDASRKAARQQHVEQILATFRILPFDLPQARAHARLWAELESLGQMIGAHDLLIAATAVAHDFDLATLNRQEFERVRGLRLNDVQAFVCRQ